MTTHPLILLDVDTQVDFMAPTGALYVPGAEKLEEQLRALVSAARAAEVPHWATVDTHTPDDPEFAAYGFPAHCVRGTAGWAKVAATAQRDARVIEHGAAVPAEARELAFLKATFDVTSNPAFARAIAAHGVTDALVCGVATDYCVKAAALGLRALGVRVALVTDAIAAVAPDTGAAALAELAAAGVEAITTAEALTRLRAREVAHVA